MDGAVEYAGFWRRWGAALLDKVIVGGTASAVSLVSAAPVVNFIVLILALAYYVYFIGHRGQTPGKMILKIKVQTIDGQVPGYKKALIRETVGKFISGLVCSPLTKHHGRINL